jgi:hypothetical protein
LSGSLVSARQDGKERMTSHPYREEMCS